MITYKIEKSSKLYKFLRKIDVLDAWDEPTDFCTISRKLFVALLAGVGILLVTIGLTFPIWTLIGSLVSFAITGELFIHGLTVGGFIGYAVIGTFAFLMHKNEQRVERKRELERAIRNGDIEAPQMGFLKTIYTNFKNKTCIKIDIV